VKGDGPIVPVNIAHMLICNKAVKVLQAEGNRNQRRVYIRVNNMEIVVDIFYKFNKLIMS
jgi:hypothetical protein